jgi:septum site-determining protein MinD
VALLFEKIFKILGKNTRTILICSGKGGVGKTTLTANLGIALANSGATTAVLDADFGLRNLDLLLGLENRIIYTAQDVLDKNCRLDQALVRHKKEPNLALLPAGDPRMLDWMKPEDMKKISELLSEKFDFVLVDCPAGVEDGFKNALAACKEAIVVTNPELSAVRDADRVIGILNTSDIEPIQLVINRVRPNMMASQEMLSIEDVQGILSLPLLGIVLEDEQVIISTNRGEPLTLSDGRSPAKKCYLNVSQRLTNKDIPIIDPKKEGKSLKDKFMRLMQTKVF